MLACIPCSLLKIDAFTIEEIANRNSKEMKNSAISPHIKKLLTFGVFIFLNLCVYLVIVRSISKNNLPSASLYHSLSLIPGFSILLPYSQIFIFSKIS